MPPASKNKTVIVGAGFLASYITRSLIADSSNTVCLASRNPTALHKSLKQLGNQILPPQSGVDITKDDGGLDEAFEGAETVVNLVGIMHGTPSVFEAVQYRGAERVALAARKAGAKTIHISAIGADPSSPIDYWRTKGLGEQAVLAEDGKATILRPSLVFGPGDGFFTRFAKLAKYLPFLPVFGGGKSLFQPVYAGDIGRAVEVISRAGRDEDVARHVDGKIIEAGGPDVFTYRQLMELTLKHAEMSRPILSLPFAVGTMQGLVLERLPENLFTVTRSQVNQLRSNNIVEPSRLPSSTPSFASILSSFPPPYIPSSAPPPKPSTSEKDVLASIDKILPEYLGGGGVLTESSLDRVKSGKRMHGKKGFNG